MAYNVPNADVALSSPAASPPALTAFVENPWIKLGAKLKVFCSSTLACNEPENKSWTLLRDEKGGGNLLLQQLRSLSGIILTILCPKMFLVYWSCHSLLAVL